MKTRFLLVSLVGLVGASAAVSACRGDRFADGDDGTGGGGGAGGAGNPTVVGETCSDVSDCENADADHCAVTCEDVDGEKRCVTTSIDADEDGHGTSACEAAPGDDCDDGDKYSFPGGPALVKRGTAQPGDFVHFASDGAIYRFFVLPAQGTYGVVTAQGINEEGTLQGDVTTYAAGSASVPVRAGAVAVAEKDNPNTIGILWPATVSTSNLGIAFGEQSLGVNANLGTTLVGATSVPGVSPGDAAWTGEVWSLRTVVNTCGNAYVSNGTTAANLGVPAQASAVLGATRFVVVEDEDGCSGTDPALVLRRLETAGTPTNQIGSDIVLISNTATADIAPSAAAAKFEDSVVVIYRDAATSVPLTFRRFAEDGTEIGSAITLDSELTPRSMVTVGPFLLLVGGAVSGDATNVLWAQLVSPEGNLLGEPLELPNGSGRITGHGVRAAVGITEASVNKHQMLRVNSCAK